MPRFAGLLRRTWSCAPRRIVSNPPLAARAQINLHLENLFRKIEQKNWTAVSAFVGADYSDEWADDRAILLTRTREVFCYLRNVRIAVVALPPQSAARRFQIPSLPISQERAAIPAWRNRVRAAPDSLAEWRAAFLPDNIGPQIFSWRRSREDRPG